MVGGRGGGCAKGRGFCKWQCYNFLHYEVTYEVQVSRYLDIVMQYFVLIRQSHNYSGYLCTHGRPHFRRGGGGQAQKRSPHKDNKRNPHGNNSKKAPTW